MTEPIFHLREKKDSLDIMLEMRMFKLLEHTLIIEVLNLVYEGAYSVDRSTLSLSETFECLFQMETFDIKSINKRILENICNIGIINNQESKQANLQFNIWKQSMQQRIFDEMIFTTAFSGFIIVSALFICYDLSVIKNEMIETFEFTINKH